MIYKFFDKKLAGSGITATIANKPDDNTGLEGSKQLARELQKPIIRNFKKKNSLFRI